MKTFRLYMTNYTFKLQMWRFWFKISFYDQFYIEVLKNLFNHELFGPEPDLKVKFKYLCNQEIIQDARYLIS